jgi:hypothetical protein
MVARIPVTGRCKFKTSVDQLGNGEFVDGVNSECWRATGIDPAFQNAIVLVAACLGAVRSEIVPLTIDFNNGLATGLVKSI